MTLTTSLLAPARGPRAPGSRPRQRPCPRTRCGSAGSSPALALSPASASFARQGRDSGYLITPRGTQRRSRRGGCARLTLVGQGGGRPGSRERGCDQHSPKDEAPPGQHPTAAATARRLGSAAPTPWGPRVARPAGELGGSPLGRRPLQAAEEESRVRTGRRAAPRHAAPSPLCPFGSPHQQPHGHRAGTCSPRQVTPFVSPARQGRPSEPPRPPAASSNPDRQI